jgi:hypothetical protein
MSLELPYSIKVLSTESLDEKYLNGTIPYTSIAQVNSLLPVGIRSIGLTVNIANQEYWYKDNTTDGGLVVKIDINDANLVHKTGNETIDGIKSFVSTPRFNSGSINILDSANDGYASITASDSTFTIRDYNNNTQFYTETGQGILIFKTNLITANFYPQNLTVNRKYTLPDATGTMALDENLVHKTGNETIAGIKTFNDSIRVDVISANSDFLTLEVANTSLIIDDQIGQITANCDFIAASLRIPGGTSTQFLKANGLIDNNTYAIDSTVVHKTGNETIAGIKDFSSDLVVQGINVGRGGSITSVLMGNGALRNNINGNNNVAIGSQALFTTTNASSLVAIGQGALYSNTTGSAGVAVGAEALNSNTIGNNNTAIGRESLKANTIGFNNTAVGRGSMSVNINGNNNAAFGYFALQNNILGSGNVAIGSNALLNATGNNNVAIGLNALQNNTSGGSNIAIGQGTSTLGITNTNSIVIGNAAVGLGSNTTVIGNISTLRTAIIYGNLLLGTTTDNDVDRLQVNGTISASASTTANQVVIKSQLDAKANIAITVRKIATNITLAESDNGTVILLTASCTVTLPNGLSLGWNCSFVTSAGVTMTYALGGSIVLINNDATTMAEKLSHTITNTGVLNEYITVGL